MEDVNDAPAETAEAAAKAGAPARITLWCQTNELRRALGGHPADSLVDEAMVATLRRMKAAVRQKAYDKTDPAKWIPTGEEIAGDAGLAATLEECRATGTRRRVYLDPVVAGTIASGAPRFARDLERAKALSDLRERERLARARDRRAQRAMERIDAIAA